MENTQPTVMTSPLKILWSRIWWKIRWLPFRSIWAYYPLMGHPEYKPFNDDFDDFMHGLDGWYGCGTDLGTRIRDHSIKVPRWRTLKTVLSIVPHLPTGGYIRLR